MTTPAAGEAAPAVTSWPVDGTRLIPDPGGRPIVLMFFQEAFTPLCSAQVIALNAEHREVERLGAAAVCVSTDAQDQQFAFADSLGIPRALFVSDEGAAIAGAYGVYEEQSKRARRSAFVIAGDGTVLLAIPWYNPSNSEQFLSIFTALGLHAAEST